MTDILDIERTEEAKGPQSGVFVAPGLPGSVVTLKPRYQNFIGGQWVAPVHGEYMANVSPDRKSVV